MISAAGQSLWNWNVISRISACSRNRPSPPSNGNLSSGPYRRVDPRGICPDAKALWNQSYSLRCMMMPGMKRFAEPMSLMLHADAKSTFGAWPGSSFNVKLVSLLRTELASAILSDITVV